ncbi:MAG: UDP-N-acetylglucosamine 2-epimerase (non-hydrolyzing) [Phycisphaerales bacterium]|nr:UDP-N-acetylglucosamine 2-epimerase (non-hydrolyzing) [Phycisphaerales bacterium]
MKIMHICGARPNFMKIAPLMRAARAHASIEPMLVHTGQHYDERMSDLFFRQLDIPAPDLNLEVGSGSHARQTADIMSRFEPVLLEHRPHWIVVVGDVNSTIACALVAAKLGVRVAHVEAGLRSFDRSMPEEINRILTDAISDLLFVSEPSGVENLRGEGVPESKIHLVGNVMIDTLLANRAKAETSDIVASFGLVPRGYALVTLHRPSNVDEPGVFSGILDALAIIQQEMPVVFPIHPRTRANLTRLGLASRVAGLTGLRLIDPVGYIEFLKLTSEAAVVLTDSGGIQEETTILGVPCLTLRENTERPITIEQGTNHLVGVNSDRIIATWRSSRAEHRAPKQPPLWDGFAANRIVKILADA